MITNYNQVKNEVLSQYEKFCDLLDDVQNSMENFNDKSFDIKKNKEKSLSILANKAENIRFNKFRLMVVGEAKSGKSTFINAYLGKEILPMDVKQCTSAIVEIRYGKTFKLIATYADNRVEIIEDEKAIYNFMIKNAAIDDDYRDIPVTIINNEIIIKKQGRKPFNDEIDDLLEGIKNDNIYHLSEKEYRAKVRKYIKEKTPNWNNIVKKIEIEYPFEDKELRGIEIIDSPGVNAEGKVGDITEGYIEKANAVMFLKPIIGSALEATSFKRFLESKSAERNKNAMFLILTRAANETSENIKRIHAEAYKQFPTISEHQIIHLDSKTELFYNKIKDMNEEELVAYMDPLVDREELDSFLQTPWFKARFKREDYLKRLKDLSNFSVVDVALNRFAHKAHYIALNDFLEHMISILDYTKDQLDDNIETYSKKAKDPQQLADELSQKSNELLKLSNKLSQSSGEIVKKYTESNGIIENKVNAVASAYEKDIDKIDRESINSVDTLQLLTLNVMDIYSDYQKELKNSIVEECNKELIQLNKNTNIPFSILKPDLTEAVITQIMEEERKKAYVIETYKKGWTFKETKKRPKFSQSKFFNLVYDSIKGKLEQIKGDFVEKMFDDVDNIIEVYKTELNENIDQLQDKYDKILEDKREAEELWLLVNNLKDVNKKVEVLTEEITMNKAGVEKHV